MKIKERMLTAIKVMNMTEMPDLALILEEASSGL